MVVMQSQALTKRTLRNIQMVRVFHLHIAEAIDCELMELPSLPGTPIHTLQPSSPRVITSLTPTRTFRFRHQTAIADRYQRQERLPGRPFWH